MAHGARPIGTRCNCLLLVRNGVDHDARVLRAARTAERTLGGGALILGAATAAAPTGSATVQGIAVVRLPARPPVVDRLARPFARLLRGGSSAASRTTRATGDSPGAASSPRTDLDGVESRLTARTRARRILSGVSYTAQAVALAHRVKPGLVHANDWNTLWTGLLVKLLCGAPLVYDSHELWADRNGRWESRLWVLVAEALLARAADRVVTSSPGYADALARRYRIARPAIVRNIPESPGVAPRNQPAAPLVVYIGGLMPGRGLEQIIDALALLPTARLRAVGPGAQRYREHLQTRAAMVGVADRVDLRRAVAPAEVPAALAEAAAGLCLIQPICRSYELCLPNKLFEYAAAGVPILASDLPVIGAIVRGEGLGELAPAGDHPQAIAASLRRLLEPERWTRAAACVGAFAAAHDWTGEALVLERVYEQARRPAA